MKTLELYNAVEAKSGGSYMILPEYGIIIEPSASHAIEDIKKFYSSKLLSGSQLNSSFHKSWKKIVNSTREELALHQLLHYVTTYGTGYTSSFVYIPEESLEVPDVSVNFLVVRGLSKDQIISKSLSLLESGVALKQETITDILSVLDEYSYKFESTDKIKNKEALMFICDKLNIVPSNPTEFIRYMIYTATKETLIIKNKDLYRKLSYIDVDSLKKLNILIKNANTKSLATVFNRYKPIFLQFKKVLDVDSKKIINNISKLSKTLHEPISYNILNDIGQCSFNDLKSQELNLKNANFFQLARAIQFLKQNENSTAKVYSIRNGRAWTKLSVSKPLDGNKKILFLLKIISDKFDLSGKKIYIPDGVQYALPTSEKMFVGNIPMGSKFTSDSLAYGVYWENSGGARDIDLSVIGVTKVGWNSFYSIPGIQYSGDMTDASCGATEFIRVDSQCSDSNIVFANIFNGTSKGSKFKVCIGKGEDDIDRNFMMDPNRVWFYADSESLTKQSIVGFVIPEKDKVSAVVLNLAFGAAAVSGSSPKNSTLRTALYEKWTNCFYLEELLLFCGANLVDNSTEAEIDLSPSKLEKDTILSLFSEE